MKVCSEDEKDPQAIESLQESRVIPGVGKSFSPRDYEGAVTRALERVRRTPTPTTTDREEARWRAAELLACSPEELEERLVPGSIYACWDVFSSLVDEILPATFARPTTGQVVARMALRVAMRLSESQVGRAAVRDARTLAVLRFANALRVGSDLARSEKLLEIAESSVQCGSGDPHLQVELLSIRSSLCRDQNSPHEAEAHCREALRLCRQMKDRRLELRMLVSLGVVFGDSGAHEAAERAFRFALRRVQLPTDPRLVLSIYHGLTVAQIGLGNLEAAGTLMGELRSLHARFPDVNARARLYWLEARLAAAREHYDEAEALYQKARSAFLEHGIEGDAALVTRELAELYLKSA